MALYALSNLCVVRVCGVCGVYVRSFVCRVCVVVLCLCHECGVSVHVFVSVCAL